MRPSIPGCGETQGEELFPSIGEYLGDKEEEELDILDALDNEEDLEPEDGERRNRLVNKVSV